MGLFVDFIMLYNIKPLSLHRVFHGIRFKVNEDWESGKIPFFILFILIFENGIGSVRLSDSL